MPARHERLTPRLAALVAPVRLIGATIGVRRVLLVIALMLACAIVEAVALALLAPLLAGLTGTPGAGHGMAAFSGLRGEGLLALFVLVACGRALLNAAQELVAARIRADFVDRLRRRLFGALQRADWLYFVGQSHGRITALLGTEISHVSAGMMALLRLPVRILLIAAQAIVAFALAPVAALIVVPVLALILLAARRRRAGGASALVASNAALAEEVQRALTGMKLAKLHADGGLVAARFAAASGAVSAEQIRHGRSEVTTRLRIQIGVIALFAPAIALGLARGWIDGPVLLVLAVIMFRIVPTIQQLQQSAGVVGHMLPSLRAIVDASDQAEAHAGPVASGGAPRLERALAFEHVDFRYPGAGACTIRDFSLVLPARSLTLITGPSGTGKTTLADLAAGLLRPQRGVIRIDGMALDARTARAWGQRVAVVPQDPMLFDGSVRANLVPPERPLPDAIVWEALARARADFVRALPRGLDEPLFAAGARLSGGERQRLAIARALLRRPSLMILDEPTSALDAAAADGIIATIGALRADLAILVIAHRERWQADQIVDLGIVANSDAMAAPAALGRALDTPL